MKLTTQNTRRFARTLKDHGVDFQVALTRLYNNYTNAGHEWAREDARAVFGVYFPLRASGHDAAAEYDRQTAATNKTTHASRAEMEALEDGCTRPL